MAIAVSVAPETLAFASTTFFKLTKNLFAKTPGLKNATPVLKDFNTLFTLEKGD